MTDPVIIIGRLGDLVTALRTWHYRATDLLSEAEAGQRCYSEVIARSGHQALLLQEQSTDELGRCRELQAAVTELTAETSSAATNATGVVTRAQDTSRAAQQVLEESLAALAAAEGWLRRARAHEQVAETQVVRCRLAVSEGERGKAAAAAALQSAEATLGAARDAWRAAARHESGSNRSLQQSSLEVAVRGAEASVARCRRELEEAITAIRLAEEELRRAEVELAGAIAERVTAERRVEQCTRARSCARKAVDFARSAAGYGQLGVRDADDAGFESEAATEAVGQALALSEGGVQTAADMRSAIERACRLLHEGDAYLNGLSGSAESGMNCCQQAIIDLAERIRALTRFEAVGIR